MTTGDKVGLAILGIVVVGGGVFFFTRARATATPPPVQPGYYSGTPSGGAAGYLGAQPTQPTQTGGASQGAQDAALIGGMIGNFLNNGFNSIMNAGAQNGWF